MENENRVYFSKIDDDLSWEPKNTNQLKCFIYPARWWSIKEWKMARMFQRDFRTSFWEEQGIKVGEKLKPCNNINCDKGKALIPGTTEVGQCPICHGTGSINPHQ